MVILYIHNLLNYHDPAPAAKAPTTLADLISFFLAYTGNLVSIFPVPDLVSWAHVIGALLIALLTVSSVAAIKTCRGKPEWSSTVIWLCFAAYQIVGGGLVTLTRHTFGVAYPVMGASRYVLATSFLPVAIIALGAVAMRALRSRLPVGLTWYSSLLCAVTAVLAICLVIRAGQIPGSLAAFSDSHRLEMNGKVAMAAANMMNLQAYRNIYPRDDWKDFQGLSAFITPRAEFPPMWDSNFVMRLAGAVANQQNFAGFVDTFAVRDGKLSLSGWAYLKAQQKPADAVITLAVPPSGKATLINVAFLSQRRPDVSKSMGNPEAMDTGWATEIAAPLPNTGSIIRSFAYDADTGQAYLLVGEGVL
jgi:hypothetical protein